MYKVIRFYESAGIRRRTIATGLTKDEAIKHCSNPQTSSSTCTNPIGIQRTNRVGRWFDGWEKA